MYIEFFVNEISAHFTIYIPDSSMVEQEAVEKSYVFVYHLIMKIHRAYADRREYLKNAVTKRRKKMRNMAISYLGGKCMFCGYNRCTSALDFHHINESLKKFGLSQDGLTRSWEKTKKELDKCILVCANCHREIHAGILQPSAEMLNGKVGEFREA